MLQEVLDHMNDCCASARPHPLAAPPCIDPLDQLRLDPDVDVCGFALHAREDGRCRAHPFDNCGQLIDNAQPLDSLRNLRPLGEPGFMQVIAAEVMFCV